MQRGDNVQSNAMNELINFDKYYSKYFKCTNNLESYQFAVIENSESKY